MGLVDDLKHWFRTKPLTYRDPGVPFENAVQLRQMHEGKLPPTVIQEVDAIAEVVKKLARGKKAKLSGNFAYDPATKMLSGPVANIDKVKALLVAAIANGMLPASEVRVDGNLLTVKI